MGLRTHVGERLGSDVGQITARSEGLMLRWIWACRSMTPNTKGADFLPNWGIVPWAYWLPGLFDTGNLDEPDDRIAQIDEKSERGLAGAPVRHATGRNPSDLPSNDAADDRPHLTAGRSLANREPAGGYGGKPRNTPFSSTASANSAQSMFAMFRLLSMLHSSRGMHRNGRLSSSSRSTTSTG